MVYSLWWERINVFTPHASLMVLEPPSPMAHHTETVDARNLKPSRIHSGVLSHHTELLYIYIYLSIYLSHIYIHTYIYIEIYYIHIYIISNVRCILFKSILAAWVEFERRAPTLAAPVAAMDYCHRLSPLKQNALEAKLLIGLCSLQAEPLEKPAEEPPPAQACQIWKRGLGCCSWHFRVEQKAHQPWPWSWFTKRHEETAFQLVVL